MKILGVAIALIQLCLPVYASESTPEQSEYYQGTIDGKFDFMMVLRRGKDGCSGSYAYLKHKKAIFLQGICEPEKFELKENSFGGKAMANRFIALKTGARVEGVWRSADGKKVFKFEATQFNPAKNKFLGEAKGEYRLNAISGFYGANTMADIYRVKGDWKASSSGISGGQREGYSASLSRADKRILSSMNITVDQGLAITIFAGGKTIAKFPYTEKSTFRIKYISKEEDNINRVYKYLHIDNFYDGKLHIATTDEMDLSEYIVFENTPLDSTYAVSLDYSPMTRVFEISIIDKNCCGGTTLEFIKQ